jgi:hypothetical protein
MARAETPVLPGISNKKANPNPVPPLPPTAVVKIGPQPEKTPAIVPKSPSAPAPLLSAREKYETRERVVQTTIPLAGDSIELQFFDNAEIDGDSIALFLNGRLLFEHVKLSAQPFVLRLSVAELPENAELSMVAENLGAIPPNTSFMMAYVNGQRHTARLESTEQTTAVIRFKRED